MQADRLNLWLAFSRTTSFEFLCSRIPRNTACRNRSSRVHSVNLTWQTIDGYTQRQRFVSAAVNPWSQRLASLTSMLIDIPLVALPVDDLVSRRSRFARSYDIAFSVFGLLV
jgi:hypothetical protein